MEGKIINEQKMNVLTVNQIEFEKLVIVIPPIKVKFLKQFSSIKQDVVGLTYQNKNNFFEIEQCDEVVIEKFIFKNIPSQRTNNNLRILNLDSQDTNNQKNYYLFLLQGIYNTTFRNSYINNFYETGIFNLSNYQANENTFVSSISLNLYNLTVEDSKNNNIQQPFFYFQNKQVKLAEMNLTKIVSQQNIIEANQCNDLEIFNSTFLLNKSFQNGGSININDVKNIKINQTTFKGNQAEISGGAIFLYKSNMAVINSTFDSNISVSEKGGAICSLNSTLNIQNSTIKNNSAIIGGGIYHDLPQNTIINNCILTENKGYFYGNNKGSKPQSIKQIDDKTNKAYYSDSIKIQNFQSGNFTKQNISLQFFDEENNFLNFLFGNDKKVSEAIKQEIAGYYIELNLNNESTGQISYGKQFRRESNNPHFKFNITVYYKDLQEIKGKLTTNDQKENIYLDVELEFRNCTNGEIKQYNNEFIGCFECQNNTYSLDDPNLSNKTSCKICPAEVQQCYANILILKDNYWRQSNLTDTIYSCPSNGCSESNQNSRVGCIEGYIGPVCASCDYRGEVWNKQYGINGNDCNLCTQLQLVYCYLVLTIVLYIIYINSSINSQIVQKSLMIKLNYLRKMDLLFLSKTIVSGTDSTVLIKIFLHYAQIISVSLDFFNSLPFEIKNTFDIVGDPSKATSSSYDCMFSSSYIPQLWLNRLIVLSFQIAFLLLITLLIRRYQSRKNPRQFRMRIYVIFLYFFYYPSITKLLISLSLCKEFGDKSYLIGDYLQECWTSDHIIISVLLIYPITILWTLIIPLIQLKTIKTSLDQKKSSSINYILSYYFIQQGYKDKYYYWEIVKMFQKFLIMIILNTSYSKHTQRIMISLICILYFSKLQKLKPYNSKSLMNIELLLSQIILYSLSLSLISDTTNSYSLIHLLTVILVILANCYGLINFLKIYFKITKIKIERQQDSKLKTFILKFIYRKKRFGKQNVPILRISQLWKKLRQAIYENKQRLSVYSKGLTLISQVKQKIVPPLKLGEEIMESSLQDINVVTSQVNSPIVSTIISARQEKKFATEKSHFLKLK